MITFNYWRPVQCFWDFLCRNIREKEGKRKEKKEGEGEGEEEESCSVLSLWLNKMKCVMEWGEGDEEGWVKKAGHWLNSQTYLTLDDWLAFLDSTQPFLGFGGCCSSCSALQMMWLGGACRGQWTVQGDHLSSRVQRDSAGLWWDPILLLACCLAPLDEDLGLPRGLVHLQVQCQRWQVPPVLFTSHETGCRELRGSQVGNEVVADFLLLDRPGVFSAPHLPKDTCSVHLKKWIETSLNDQILS